MIPLAFPFEKAGVSFVCAGDGIATARLESDQGLIMFNNLIFNNLHIWDIFKLDPYLLAEAQPCGNI